MSADAGYGKDPAFLRALDNAGDVFVANAHKSQRVWPQAPEPHIPSTSPGRGHPPQKRQVATVPVTVADLVTGFGPADWVRCVRRDSPRGPLQVDLAQRRVWLWDGEEAVARCRHLLVRREVGSPQTIKYSLCNAPAETPLLRLGQMQGQRYWVERTFEDANGPCGLADYQALGWRAWHHHVSMVMLAMLFIAEQRAAHQEGLDLLRPHDTRC